MHIDLYQKISNRRQFGIREAMGYHVCQYSATLSGQVRVGVRCILRGRCVVFVLRLTLPFEFALDFVNLMDF